MRAGVNNDTPTVATPAEVPGDTYFVKLECSKGPDGLVTPRAIFPIVW